MIDVNPAKQGVDNPQRRRTEKRPFESWAQLAAVASKLGECSGALVMFAAATGLRPGEWIALERRDIDKAARVVFVRRAYRNGRLKCTKTEGSVRAVPLQEIALEAIARMTMIDRHYGHLARDGRDHAINLLDAYSRPDEADVHQVDVVWTLQQRAVATSANRKRF
jgi:integrase